jgi:hypothetical protein
MDSFTIDHFLTEDQENAIFSLTTNPMFPWFFQNGTILQRDATEENEYIHTKGSNPPQFTHTIDLENCRYIEVIAPILNAIAVEMNGNIQIIKMKFNLLYKSGDGSFHFPHTDVDELDGNIYTSIYYVNDSDGDTYLFNQKGPRTSEELSIKTRITPSKGKMVVFDAVQFHSSSSPIKSDYRIVLNTVFKKDTKSE